MNTYRPSELHRHGFRAKKHLSQNFLIDRNIIEKICLAADVQEEDNILEIGPGPGALTEFLLKKGANVIAVEKDEQLASKLSRFSCSQLKIYHDDALTFSLDQIPKNTKIVANLPYHITTPLIERFITLYPQIQSLTIMVQREVGKRMTAKVNTSEYSSFTIFLQAYSKPKYAFTVKPTSFSPAPSVHSCVIHLPLHPFPFPFKEEEFFALTRRAFGQRRKMLRSSLRGHYPTEKLGSFATQRPQELSIEEFAGLLSKLQPSENDEKSQNPPHPLQ